MNSLVKPFKAFYYNPKKIKNLSSVVCPPYDIISKKEKRVFKRKSKYNFCNILLVDNKNNYKSLASRFRDWIEDEILIQDTRSCFYLYEQEFSYEEKRFRRVGFLGLLKLNGKDFVFPHERTLMAPKKDRFHILKEMKANLSPIFVITDKRLCSLKNIHSQYVRKSPFLEFKDFQGIRNRLWRVDDRNAINSLLQEVRRRDKLFIADGHHRFEVAYKYFKLNANRFKGINYILAYITCPSTGLLILPTHRVVKVKESVDQIIKKLSPYFLIKVVDESQVKRNLYWGQRGFSFALYGKGQFYFLKLRDERILDKVFKDRNNQIYRKLDVWILHKFVFGKLNIENIEYAHTIQEVKKIAKNKKVGFILKTISLDTVFSIAKKGKLLPQKSTYFYPKLLSGLVLRRFNT
jgi:uncharacterized protein (DUF1015 family)